MSKRFELVSLQNLLQSNKFRYEKFISSFSCRSEELNDFVKNSAIRYEKENRARSYFIINSLEDNSKSPIMAFFSLSNSFLVDIRAVSNTLYKALKKSSKNEETQDFPGIISTFLIGQLGRNSCYKHDELNGDEILNCAFNMILESF